jgi:UDP-N-acetyl-2-amino-2-deoxyglucuronate dehydrogenase
MFLKGIKGYTAMNQKNFALIGVAGYIAPRHLQAIRDTGNVLVAALDPHDSVGILDSHFPEVQFFSEFERFDRHLEKLRRKGDAERVHVVSICSPNYLHDSHIRFALRIGADAICEKPVVLNPWNIKALLEMEKETGKKVFPILQLRLHPQIQKLRNDFCGQNNQKKQDIELTYISFRGPWYKYSWKGMNEKSGGLVTNIGIHFFDMLSWIFGKVERSEVHLFEATRAGGFFELESARVRWFLSTESKDLPFPLEPGKKAMFRAIKIGETLIDFTEGFGDLHTKSYQEILSGRGFSLNDAFESIDLVHRIRNTSPMVNRDWCHPRVLELLGKA